MRGTLSPTGSGPWSSAIDLIAAGAIVSKYIGETEKNMKWVFVDADALDLMLSFDEANAFFI